MVKVTGKMIKHHNYVTKILKIHCCGWGVFVRFSDKSLVCGKVCVKDNRLYINGVLVENKIITKICYWDRKRRGNNGNGKGA